MAYPGYDPLSGLYPPTGAEGSSWSVNPYSPSNTGYYNIALAQFGIDQLGRRYFPGYDDIDFDPDTYGGLGEPGGPGMQEDDREFGSPVTIVQRDETGKEIGRVPGVRIGVGDNSRVVTAEELIRINEQRRRSGQSQIYTGSPGYVPEIVDPSGGEVIQTGGTTTGGQAGSRGSYDPTLLEGGAGTDPGGMGPQPQEVSSVSELPDASQGVQVLGGGSGGGMRRIVVGGKALLVPEWVGNVGGYLRSLGATAGLVSAVQDIETKRETDREAEVQQARDKEIAEIRDKKIQELEKEIEDLRQEDIEELDEEKKKRLQEIDSEIDELRKEKIDSLKADIDQRKEKELADLEVEINSEEEQRRQDLDTEIQNERNRREAQLEAEIANLSETEKREARESLARDMARERQQRLADLDTDIKSQRETRMSNLQSEIDQKYAKLNSEIEAARETQFSDLDADYKEKLDAYNSQVSNIENQITDLSEQKSALTSDISSLTGQRDDLNLTIDELTGRAATQQEALSGLTSEQLAARQNLNELLAQQTQTKSAIDELLGQKQTLSTDYSNLQSSFSGLQTDYTGMQAKYQDLTLELEDINKRIEEAKNNPIFDNTDPSTGGGDPGAGDPTGGGGTGGGGDGAGPDTKDPGDDGDIFEDTEPKGGPDMTYDITGRGRIVPETRQEVLKDLFGFAPDYASLAKVFGPQMAEAGGVNIESFGEQAGVPMLDIAEMFTQRRRAGLAGAMGAEGDLTVDAAAEAAARINPVMASMLEGAQSLNPLIARMEEEAMGGLTPRQERQIRQTERAYKSALGQELGRSAPIDESVAVILGEKADFAQDVSKIADIRGRQAAIGTQLSALQQPFVSTALSAGDIGTGMGFASGIAGMAAEAVPTVADLFSLQAQERDFALQQEALDQAAKAGDFDAVTTILGGLRAGQKMGFIPDQKAVQGFVGDIFGGVKKGITDLFNIG